MIGGSNKNQIKTLYPYSRQEVFQMFKIPVNTYTQLSYDLQDSIEIIQEEVQQLKKYYRNFQVQFCEKIPSSFPKKGTMNKKFYGSFKCNPCNKKFTSILGNYQIKFTKQKFRKQIYCQNKIYSLQCKQCKNWCEGKIFLSQLRAVAKSFCIILAEILQEIPPPKYQKVIKDDRFKLRQNHWHKEQLCEACQNGVCFNISRNQSQRAKAFEKYSQSNDQKEEVESKNKIFLKKQTRQVKQQAYIGGSKKRQIMNDIKEGKRMSKQREKYLQYLKQNIQARERDKEFKVTNKTTTKILDNKYSSQLMKKSSLTYQNFVKNIPNDLKHSKKINPTKQLLSQKTSMQITQQILNKYQKCYLQNSKVQNHHIDKNSSFNKQRQYQQYKRTKWDKIKACVRLLFPCF